MDLALLLATLAIDATARNLFSEKKCGSKLYKKCLREYLWLIERFAGEGLNLKDTRFTYITLRDGNDKIISKPDLADIIYHVLRCSDAHANEIPVEYELLPSDNNKSVWKFDNINKSFRMPEQIIFALLGISVFCKANSKLKSTGSHYLEWGSDMMGYKRFLVMDYWGKEDEIKAFFSKKPQQRMLMDFRNWNKLVPSE